MRFAQTWSFCSVQKVRDLTPQIREFTLLPDGGVEHYAVGSHLDVNVMIDGRPETRSYSLIGDAGPEAYRVAVRLAADGRGGSRYMWSLQPGARLEISSPSNSFELDWTRSSYCLIAGGIGITPLVGIAATLQRRAAAFTLHYCATSRRDAAYLDDLAEKLGDRLQVHASDEGHRLDLDATIARLPADAMVILCGPLRLLDAARQSWSAAGRPASDLSYETFGSSGLLSTEAFRVRIRNSGAEIVVPPNRSMLDVLNEAGHEVMSDCRRGECGVCAIDVVALDGQIDHRDVFFSAHQRQENRKMCPCVSRAHGVVTVDTAYRPDRA
ncbi:MAG: PDR/VanB family oxidoreductase [Xanthobacteraceae bacterium]